MADPKTDAYWVEAPGGDFEMGINDDEARAFVMANTQLGMTPERVSDEVPKHAVKMKGFFIARAPLTNAEFQAFVDAGGYDKLDLFTDLIRDCGAKVKEILATFCDTTGQPGPSTWAEGKFPADRGDHPVEGICYYEAAACARFYGARLPTEEEWEYAARYPDGRAFPWGNDIPGKEIANFKPNRVGTTSATGRFAMGSSELGCVDLAGNVHEWVSSRYGAYDNGTERYRFCGDESARVARGGAYTGDIWDLRTTSRFGVNARQRFLGLGVRLAKNPN